VATGEHPVVFALGIALTVGLLLTAIVTFQADVLPRPAAALLLAATAGFFFVFFVAEFLPPAAGQIGSAVFGAMLALGFAWIGVALWLGPRA
jgi:zinc transporter ZupT